jgi:hypothetical protein
LIDANAGAPGNQRQQPGGGIPGRDRAYNCAMGSIGRLAAGVVCALAACGCGAVAGDATPAWSFSPEGYFSDRSFAESVFTADVALIHDRGDFGGELVALNGRDGSVRWRRSANWMAHPPGRVEPLWIVDDPPNQAHAQLVRIDAASGKETARVTLARPLSTLGSRMLWADGLILAFSYEGLRAVDPTDGSTRWTISVPDGAYLFPPLVRGRTVLLQGKSYIAIDARTGHELWRHDGECCTALTSPDGRELYLRGKVGVTDRLDWSGRQRSRLTGELKAVSDSWVALQLDGRFAVFRHGAADPGWSQPTSKDVYVGAVTLSADDLFYFSSEDSTLWRRNLASGRTRAMRAAHSRLVISTDASGVAPAYIGAAPIVAPPYLFVLDWIIHAYRLD